MRMASLWLVPREHHGISFSILDSETRRRRADVKHPVANPKTPNTKNDLFALPAVPCGDKPIWEQPQTSCSNPMKWTTKGHVWFSTARIRPPSAIPNSSRRNRFFRPPRAVPSPALNHSGRRFPCYDPASGKFTLDPYLPLLDASFELRARRQQTRCGCRAASAGRRDRLGEPAKIFEERRRVEVAGPVLQFIVDHQRQNASRGCLCSSPTTRPIPTKDKRHIVTTYAVCR